MKPRITISTKANGFFEIFLNETGRDLLVKQLNALDRSNDHFHCAPEDFLHDLAMQDKPYADDDTINAWGKVLFRPDDWDAEYFPHVLDPES